MKGKRYFLLSFAFLMSSFITAAPSAPTMKNGVRPIIERCKYVAIGQQAQTEQQIYDEGLCHGFLSGGVSAYFAENKCFYDGFNFETAARALAFAYTSFIRKHGFEPPTDAYEFLKDVIEKDLPKNQKGCPVSTAWK